MEGGKKTQVVVLWGEEGHLITRQWRGGKSLAPGEEVRHEAYLAMLTGHFLTLKSDETYRSQELISEKVASES